MDVPEDGWVAHMEGFRLSDNPFTTEPERSLWRDQWRDADSISHWDRDGEA